MSENTNINELKEQILEKEDKKTAFSDKFEKLGEEVKGAIKRQDSDEALKIITLGALSLGSSDVHYDNNENDVVIRFRIDGILTDIFTLEKKQYKLILERTKYSSALKLNITNIPQDGKYSILDGEKKLDIRVSTLPIKFGENIVCRVLDATKAIIDFEDLGFFWTTKRMLEQSLEKRNGLVLVTGPTGSGKTTSLYTMISKLNERSKKIITLEDPIEYELGGIVQAEVNEKSGFTYEQGLKALLRQDPDIIMVGEIRDYDTLNIAANASLTGHLVLSTLHTKSASETLDRIANMGLKPYVVAASVDTIIAQRLVRRICPHCKAEVEKTKNEKALIQAMLNETGMKNLDTDHIKLYKGSGCEHCNHTGYKGRIGIYEILRFTDEIREIIREGATSSEIIEKARKNDFISMKEDGVLKAIKGHTTIEEILRVI
ncbi:MAG: GspE/PulE family protein [Candidatus Gracilibacteria bacterium]|nr:GspE/PulE family protein [Candidatus Gracilibacteria bacterium]